MIKKQKKEENIYNFPNLITLSRILLSLILIYLVIKGFGIWAIVIIFAITAFTDFLDGYVARKYNQVTNFGRRFDLVADRFLMISVVITLLIYMILNNLMTQNKIIEILLIMTREIITLPFLVIAFILKKRPAPHARNIAKFTTALQGVTLPVLLIGWSIGWYLAIICCLTGIVSAGVYINDSVINPNNKFQKKMDKEYKI